MAAQPNIREVQDFMPQFSNDFLTQLYHDAIQFGVDRQYIILSYLSVLDEREQLLLKDPNIRNPFWSQIPKSVFGSTYRNNSFLLIQDSFPGTKIEETRARFQSNNFLLVPTFNDFMSNKTLTLTNPHKDKTIIIHPHTCVDTTVLADDDLFKSYIHLFYEQQSDIPDPSQPPPMTIQPVPDDSISFHVDPWTVKNLANYRHSTQIQCSYCGSQVYPHEAMECSHFHILCSDCLHTTILDQIPFLRSNVWVDEDPQIPSVQLRCPIQQNGVCGGTFLPGDLPNHLFEYELKILTDPSILRIFTSDTLKSGCCPLCFFPLTRMYGQKYSFRCKTCKQNYFWKRSS